MIPKLIITSATQVFTYDPNTRNRTTIRMGDGEYYGLTGRKGLWILSHSAINNLDPGYRSDPASSVRGYLSCTDCQSRIKSTPDLSMPHQILLHGDKIYATNTGKNCLSVYSTTGQLIREEYPSNRKWDRTPSMNHEHYNSIGIHEDRLFLLAHNHGRPSELWILSLESLEVERVVATDAIHAHNIWHDRGEFIICNSRDGSLYHVNEARSIWKSEEPNVMTRGLAVSSDYIFIGRTEFGRRYTRKINNGGVWIVDRKSLRTVHKMVFKGSGCIHEVRILDEPDLCHGRHVLRSKELHRLQSVPRALLLAHRIRPRNRAYNLALRIIHTFGLKEDFIVPH